MTKEFKDVMTRTYDWCEDTEAEPWLELALVMDYIEATPDEDTQECLDFEEAVAELWRETYDISEPWIRG